VDETADYVQGEELGGDGAQQLLSNSLSKVSIMLSSSYCIALKSWLLSHIDDVVGLIAL